MPRLALSDKNLSFAAATQLAAINSHGIHGVDVFVGHANSAVMNGESPAQIDLAKHTEHAIAVREQLQQAKLSCGIVRSDVGTDDIDAIVKLVEIAKLLNCEFITVNVPTYASQPGQRALLAQARSCYQDLNQISAETGIDALISLCPDSICPNPDAAMRILEGLDPSQVGVLFNPALCADATSITRSVDCLGPFLRALSVSPSDKAAVSACCAALAAHGRNLDELLISTCCDDPKAAAALL